MTLLAKLQAIATALNDILGLSQQVQTELTALDTFLDQVLSEEDMAGTRARSARSTGHAARHTVGLGNEGELHRRHGRS